MALAHDASTSAATADSNTGFNTLTWAHTCTGSNRVLLVAAQILNASSQTVSGITYAGVALTLVDSQDNGTATRTELWRLIAPATGANNIVITLAAAATARMVGGGISFTDAHQTTPLSATVKSAGSNTPISNNISSAATEIVVDFPSASGGTGTSLAKDASQSAGWSTAAANDAGVAVVRGGGSYEAGSATTTMSWTVATSQTWAHLVVAVKPVAAAANTIRSQCVII